MPIAKLKVYEGKVPVLDLHLGHLVYYDQEQYDWLKAGGILQRAVGNVVHQMEMTPDGEKLRSIGTKALVIRIDETEFAAYAQDT